MAEFKLPELGENITSGTVTKVLVKVGDKIEKEQPVVELETEKAVVEVPSDAAGTVQEIRVKEGDTVNVGQVILVLGEEAPENEPPKEKKAPPKPEKKEEPTPEKAPPEQAEEEAAPYAGEKAFEAGEKKKPAGPEAAPKPERAETGGKERRLMLAAPSVRRLAREMGVDLQQVKGSGPGGRISAADVKAQAGKKEEAKPAEKAPKELATEPGREKASPPLDSDKYGRFERQPMSGVRKSTMQHITTAWETIPHVTQTDWADVTELEKFRKTYGKRVEAAGAKLTVTVIVVKVVAEALKKFPRFNAFVDVENEEILLKHYVNIGVAVDTEHGLMVPVVHGADGKSLTELAVEVGRLAQRARERKIAIEDLQGGTFTVTNLGGIGGLWFSPIIREPEAAILGVSRAVMEPVWMDGEFKPRLMLPLSLSYDHRIIDGADAARFMRWLVEALEQPMRMALD